MLSDINVTPLVDVVLVLLIVFMITVPAIVSSAPIKVDLPETGASRFEPLVKMRPRRLELWMRRDSSGEIVCYVGERHTPLANLRQVLQEAQPAVDEPVKIAADKGIPYGQVVQVIDIVHSIGCNKVILDTKHVEP